MVGLPLRSQWEGARVGNVFVGEEAAAIMPKRFG